MNLEEVIQIATTVAVAAGVVFSVRSATQLLAVEIRGLRESVTLLKGWLETHSGTLTDHERRIGTLEGITLERGKE